MMIRMRSSAQKQMIGGNYMKRLITFALVLVMLASMLALPAMASEIQPRYPVGYCRFCGEEAEYCGLNGNTNEYQYYCNPCNRWFYIPA